MLTLSLSFPWPLSWLAFLPGAGIRGLDVGKPSKWLLVTIKEKRKRFEGQGFKKYKNRGPKGNLKQGIPDTVSQRHIRNQKMPPGTSLSGDRTATGSGKRSHPAVRILPVKLPSHGAVGVWPDRAWQRLMVSSPTQWVYWARQTQHGCPFIISYPSGCNMEMLNKTSGIFAFTAKTSWVSNFYEQLQDC